MLMWYLIDTLCGIIVTGFIVIAVGLAISCAVIMIGEKKKWW